MKRSHDEAVGTCHDNGEEKDRSAIEAQESFLFTTTDESFAQCYEWLVNSKVQGLHDVEFKKSDRCHSYGCYAKRDYQIGDVIFEIPQSCLYGFHLIYHSTLTHTIIATAKRTQVENLLSPEFILWLHMIEQRSNHSFPFYPYLSSLSASSPTIDNWPKEYLQLLDGTNLASAIDNDPLAGYGDFLNDIWESYTDEMKNNVSAHQFSIPALRWARGQYLSRRYPERFITIEPSAIELRDSLPSSNETHFGKMGVMVPLLDILNHNDEYDWLRFEINNNNLQVICNHPVKTGEELFSNYGDLSNERLLYAYGFALENNKHDTVTLKLSVQSNLSHLQSVFYLSPGGMHGVPEEMWKVISYLYQGDETNGCENNNLDEIVETPIEIGIEECEILFSFIQNKLNKLQSSEKCLFSLLKNTTISPEAVKYSKTRRVSCDAKIPDPRLLFIKCYLDGQITILDELVQELEEIIQGADFDEC